MDSEKIMPSAPPMETQYDEIPPKYEEFPPSYEDSCKGDNPPPYKGIYPWAQLEQFE